MCNELDANVLEALFCKQTEERENAEIQVLEFVNGMKFVVDGDENKEDAA